MKNIILVGFMGTGKSVVGKRLAKQLKMRFINTDDIISAKYLVSTDAKELGRHCMERSLW